MSLSSLSESVLDLNVALTTVINLEKVLIDKEVIDESGCQEGKERSC
jgi:hypothetical protein